MNRFSFHETDFLARDLAKLLQQTASGSNVEIDAARIAPHSSHIAFPGIILLYDGRACAAMGYSTEPCATVVVTQPVMLIDAADQVRVNLCQMLLERMKQRSVDAGFLQMNFLQHDSSNDSFFLSVLTEQSFVPVSRILQWELSTSPGPSANHADFQSVDIPFERRNGDCTIHRFDTMNADADEVHEVRTSLDAILRSSDDLSDQARPQADELLAKWQSVHASIFTCCIQGKIAGILSCAAGTDAASASEIAQACAVESVSESYVSLEYIGVVAEFRRRQVASWLICQIPQLLLDSVRSMAPGSVSAALTVKAFSDAANAPATALYQSRGFLLAAKMQLWRCNLIGRIEQTP